MAGRACSGMIEQHATMVVMLITPLPPRPPWWSRLSSHSHSDHRRSRGAGRDRCRRLCHGTPSSGSICWWDPDHPTARAPEAASASPCWGGGAGWRDCGARAAPPQRHPGGADGRGGVPPASLAALKTATHWFSANGSTPTSGLTHSQPRRTPHRQPIVSVAVPRNLRTTARLAQALAGLPHPTPPHPISPHLTPRLTTPRHTTQRSPTQPSPA